MLYSNQELVMLWSNDKKRNEFARNYKVWGIWLAVPELGLTYYKYDLPDNSRLIAMEYLREPYYCEESVGDNSAAVNHQLYLQCGKYFTPSPTQDYQISEHLKKLKMKLMEEQKQDTRSDSQQVILGAEPTAT